MTARRRAAVGRTAALMALGFAMGCPRSSAVVPMETMGAREPLNDAHLARASAEVEALHQFFVEWFRGERVENDASFERFESALGPEFEMVVPSGASIDRDAVLGGVRSAHGQWRDDAGASIEVRAARARDVGGGLVLVHYEEWQRTGATAQWKGRQSTALLRLTGDRFVWVHVHETWLTPTD